MPSNPPSRYMTTIYHYFLSFLRQNRNKTCPELTKLRSHKNISGEHALEPSLQSWAPAEIFVGGGASPKRSPHHEVKSSKKAPKNEKNVANRPPYEEKVAKRPPIEPQNFFSFSCGRPCLQSRGFNIHYFLYKK